MRIKQKLRAAVVLDGNWTEYLPNITSRAWIALQFYDSAQFLTGYSCFSFRSNNVTAIRVAAVVDAVESDEAAHVRSVARVENSRSA